MNRTQIHPYIQPEVRKRLRIYAGRKGVSESAVAQSALIRYLDDTNESALIIKRLDRLSRGLGRAQRDVEVLSEAFAIFVQLWLAHTPRLPDAERPAAERSALARFSQFLDHLAGKVASGRTFVREVSPDDESAPAPAADDEPTLVGERNTKGDEP